MNYVMYLREDIALEAVRLSKPRDSNAQFVRARSPFSTENCSTFKFPSVQAQRLIFTEETLLVNYRSSLECYPLDSRP